MISNHYDFTGSTVARAILDDWQTAQKRFVKVMPRDYKRVLEERKAKLQEAI
jgi:glutamate synthase (NADPH/NADH) large chain